jgi:hypothetical protein
VIYKNVGNTEHELPDRFGHSDEAIKAACALLSSGRAKFVDIPDPMKKGGGGGASPFPNRRARQTIRLYEVVTRNTPSADRSASQLEQRECPMPAKRAPKPSQSWRWRISIFKKKLQYVGRVQAADKPSAELAAATEFQLKDHERARLLIEEAV